MQIDLNYYGLLKAWMNRKVKNCCMMMMTVLSQIYLAKNMLTDFVFCTILVPDYEFMVAHCHCERANWSHGLARRVKEMSL